MMAPRKYLMLRSDPAPPRRVSKHARTQSSTFFPAPTLNPSCALPTAEFMELSPSCCRLMAFFNGQDGFGSRGEGMSGDAFYYNLLLIRSAPAAPRPALHAPTLHHQIP